MPRFRHRLPGDPVSHASLRRLDGGPFATGSLGGRWVVIGFADGADTHAVMAARHMLSNRHDLLDGCNAVALLVLPQPPDPTGAVTGHAPLSEIIGQAALLHDRIAARPAPHPGLHLLLDPASTFARAEGAADADPDSPGRRPLWLICDPQSRLLDSLPMAGPDGGAAAVLTRLAALPPPRRHCGFPVQAPVLILPRVFEPDLCQALMACYDAAGGALSGVMRTEGGRTVGHHDPGFKVRRDHLLDDPSLIARTKDRISRRVVPEMARAYAFCATRLERYLVACYDGTEGGHFAAHRDNTTPGTAHRRFALSVNLNDGFDGGEVVFPEYGPQGFVPPPGGAVIFSCALLHRVNRVTAGRRYAFLPFLHDETGERIRERNLHTLHGTASLGPHVTAP
jgi:predicted 2-oxoglutarate/Fe(II)-dependent dioxygenase YbiX